MQSFVYAGNTPVNNSDPTGHWILKNILKKINNVIKKSVKTVVKNIIKKL